MRRRTLPAALAVSLLATPALADTFTARQFWDQLHRCELTALNDYKSRNISPAVLGRSQSIWSLQSDARLEDKFTACRSAAKSLAQMVSSTYFDAKRGQIPMDWYKLSPGYRVERSRCLEAIGLKEDSYPLPWWFGM